MLFSPSSLLVTAAIATVSAAVSHHPAKSSYGPLPSLREQEKTELGWVKEREAFVGEVLEKYGFDAYLVSQREYAEDTIFRSFNPYTTTFSARRRTVYLFHTSPHLIPSPLRLISNSPSDIFSALNHTLTLIDAQHIALNIDEHIAFSDGLHAGEERFLKEGLGENWVKKMGSERMLGVEVVARRVGGKEQERIWKRMQENVWAMIEEGFSNKVITPNVTTTNDVVWFFRERMETMNATTWFQPSVSLFRGDYQTNPDQPFPSPDEGDDAPVIREGDMLHVDIGVFQMGMATDTQHLAYVLRQNETSPPAGLVAGLRKSNRMQDLVRESMVVGKSGDDVLADVHAKMKAEGIEGLVYSHPIGDYGHSAGAPIGMTNLQKTVPHSGPLPLLPHTWYSVELSTEHFVPEWNRTQNFFQEEDVIYDAENGQWEWAYGRQEHFHLVHQHPKAAEQTTTTTTGTNRSLASTWWRLLFPSSLTLTRW